MLVTRYGTMELDGDEALRSMFRARKSVFVDLLGWDVPILDGQYEIDQFDTEHARYLIVTSPEGEHLASARLLPTVRPHILDSLFADLCEGQSPRGEEVYEVTRFCLSRGRPASERRIARNQLVSAIADFALAEGIRTYVGVAELAWLQQILAFGWRCRPLGLPRSIDGQMLGALAIDITRETPALLAANGIYCGAAEVRLAVAA